MDRHSFAEGAFGRTPSAKKDWISMDKRPTSKIKPFESPATFLDFIRAIVCSIVPYRGVLSVTFPAMASKGDPTRSERLTSDRSKVPANCNPRFQSFELPGAPEALADELVSRLITDAVVDYDGDMVLSLYEASDRTPIAAKCGERTLYIEFGGVHSTGYRLP